MLIMIIILNAFSYVLMLADKQQAILKRQRVPESTFMLCSMLGGWPMIYMAMYVFRHKTKKASFGFKIFFGMLVNIALIWIYYQYIN